MGCRYHLMLPVVTKAHKTRQESVSGHHMQYHSLSCFSFSISPSTAPLGSSVSFAQKQVKLNQTHFSFLNEQLVVPFSDLVYFDKDFLLILNSVFEQRDWTDSGHKWNTFAEKHLEQVVCGIKVKALDVMITDICLSLHWLVQEVILELIC